MTEIPPLDLRPLTSDDRALLREATVINVNWTGVERLAPAEVDALPELTRYWESFPGVGEFGFAAELDGRPVGVIWAVYSSEGDRAYGYVADDIPELSVTVWEGHRGQGIGFELLEALETEAVRRGLRGLSLSVEHGNASARLYLRRGFLPAGDEYPDSTMVKYL